MQIPEYYKIYIEQQFNSKDVILEIKDDRLDKQIKNRKIISLSINDFKKSINIEADVLLDSVKLLTEDFKRDLIKLGIEKVKEDSAVKKC